MERVMIAMSGGVDSSVAALLLREAGFACGGVMMRLLPESDPGDAAAVCDRLGIPFAAPDFTAAFRERVIDPFVRVYEAGGTPNPCVTCNRFLKFGLLLDYALSQGYDSLATGHYVRVTAENGRYQLRKAKDLGRDQSYFLYTLTQDQLARARFPLGELTKDEVRTLARGRGFVNAARRDSQDICFIPDGDYPAFLTRYTGKTYPAGDFVSPTGERLGTHRGAVRYTLGQRRGLELPMGERIYVLGKDMAQNTVTVGAEEALFASQVLLEAVSFVEEKPPLPGRLLAKTRSRQREEPAVLQENPDGTYTMTFDRPQRAVTPGQAAVFYDEDRVVGGGTILTAR